MLRLPLVPDCFLLAFDFFGNFLLLAQHFIRSDLMEDGQEAGEYTPDSEEDDPADFEYNSEIPPVESTDEDESSGESSESDDPADDADIEAADTRNADTRDADAGTAAQGGYARPFL